MAHKIYNWYWKVTDSMNVLRATNNTIRGKRSRFDVQRMMEQGYIETMQQIWELLSTEQFTPSRYTEKTINDGKERHLKIAPLFPDRIVHHCLVDVLEEHVQKLFIANTYACVRGRGIHKCLQDLNRALQRDKRGTRYCLKIDIRHYYDNISHEVLKSIIAKSVGDKRLLRLIYLIIDSTEGNGIPIGFLTSQYFANWYLTPFDHWIKEVVRVRYYYRYMDDIVILGRTKTELHELLEVMRKYLDEELGLEIKPNWQVFPVDARSIDFVGYKSNHYNILARASILKRYWRKLHKLQRKAKERGKCFTFEQAVQELASHYGWLQHCTNEHFEEIMKRTYQQLFNFNSVMNTNILKIGLLSTEVQPTFDNIDRVKGTTLYNFDQQWVEVEDEHGEKVRMNQYNSLLVPYPLTRKHVFQQLITAKYEADDESKLLNDYNASVLGLEDESKQQPYLDFLADRKQLRAMVVADCAAHNVPEE